VNLDRQLSIYNNYLSSNTKCEIIFFPFDVNAFSDILISKEVRVKTTTAPSSTTTIATTTAATAVE